MNAISNHTNCTDIQNEWTNILKELTRFLNIYYQIFMISVGLVGNMVTIYIFWKTKLTHSRRTSFYLITLAISDCGFLVVLLFQYLDRNGYLFTISTSRVICKLTFYFSYVFNFYSCVLVLAFTVQRLCSIRFPLRFNLKKIETRSKIAIAFLFLIGCCIYMFSLFIFDLVEEELAPLSQECRARDGYENLAERFNFFDSLITLILPFLGLLIMNALIIQTLKNSNYNFVLRTSSNRHFAYEPSTIKPNKRQEPNELLLESNEAKRLRCRSLPNAMNRSMNIELRKRLYKSRLNKKPVGLDNFTVHLSSFHLNYHKQRTNAKEKKSFVFKNETRFFNKYKSKSKHPKKVFSSNFRANRRKSSNVCYKPQMGTTTQSMIVHNNNNNNNINNLKESRRRFNRMNLRSLHQFSKHRTNSISRKVTKMLMIVSSTFLILNLPVHTFNIYINIRVYLNGCDKYSSTEHYLKEIFDNIFYTSFACNFLLYSISGVMFRTELKCLIRKFFKLKKKSMKNQN